MVRFSTIYLINSYAAVALVASPSVARSQEGKRHSIEVPAQRLGESLKALAFQTGVTVVADSTVVANKQAPALHGTYSVEEALRILLSGSGLVFTPIAGGFAVRAIGNESRSDPAGTEAGIVVTGSRIRGAPIASPVIRLDNEEMRDAGQNSLTDVVRSIPQSFGGGQNLGVGTNVGTANGIDVGGAVTINLRGLGSDATLTLLNGHRLAYNGSRQGIDVSSLPIGAVDRLEVMPDGASALYGSDAVAGVANIILRKDYSGLRAEAEGGVATEGGYSRQRYALTTGTRWQSGGVLVSYEFARSTDLRSDDRDFASSRPGVIIYPPVKRHALVLTGHQALSDNLTFQADFLYNHRNTAIGYAYNEAGDRSISRIEQPTTSRSIALAPSLTLTLPHDWQVALSGVYGNERVFTRQKVFEGSDQVSLATLCYCNDGQSVELAGDGPLFSLPGGVARLAVGTGYRRNALNADRGAGNVANVRQTQDSYYGYGELNLPIVSPDMAVPLMERLNLSAALRYERYPGIASVATPKLGVIYAPFAWIDIKGSWGRSFRAPSLMQQYQVPWVNLYPVTRLGGTGYADGATALLVAGGNPDLKPEKAKTWTASLDIHPDVLRNARLQVSYFHTLYTDRIVTPIALAAQSLSNPAYTSLVTLDPGADVAADLIADAQQFYNYSGAAVDTSKVVAIVDNRNFNAGRQRIHGVDVLADYRFALGEGDLTASLNASYLKVDQQLGPGQAIVARSGLVFTPPHWRGRAGLSWSGTALTLNGTVSVIGGVDDTRTDETVAIHGMTTLDLTARYRPSLSRGPLRGVELNLSVLNALDARPQTIASTTFADSTYDSTNYSPLGRVISFGVAKSW